MSESEFCPECNTPFHITREHHWLSSGVIVQTNDERNRLAFIESENFDPLYRNIGELIGMPIEHIVIEASRRATRGYIGRMVPEETKQLVREGVIAPDVLVDTSFRLARLMGYGNASMVEYRIEHDAEDYMIVRVAEPYSALLWYGNFAGTFEAIAAREVGVVYKELSPGLFEATISPREHPQELRERLTMHPFKHSDGGIELKRCSTCGGPSALSVYDWDLERGTIGSSLTGRRMALLGPHMVDPTFQELERELGEDIAQVVIEAQRRFTRTGFYAVAEIVSEEAVRVELAVRGMGNVRELKMGKQGVTLRVDNVALHLMVIGLAQGLFELAFGLESEVSWELSEEGALELTIIPA